MTRCEKCGKQINEGGDLCNACRTELKYYYVSKLERKRPKKSMRARMREWWWPLLPEERLRNQKLTVILAAVVVVILAALFFFRPGPRGEPENHNSVTGAIIWEFSAK